MLIVLFCLLALIIFVYYFMRQPSFGSAPTGRRLARILQSPNYRDGQFQNISNTPALTEGVSYYSVFRKFFFARKPMVKPPAPLPSVKIDLLHLNLDEQVLVWFGHSSYFLQVDGKRILVDPVFSGNASPVSFTTHAFPGSDRYDVEDLPPIDYLFISHDHWDHLDYKTILKLKHKTGLVITGLGVGAHFERWGYEPGKVIEKDWNETVDLGGGFTVHTAPGRHFSGRGFKRNGSLWLSFVLLTPRWRLFLGGDSGYDTHFKTIGERFGPFDLALLEDGQYDPSWKYIHMMPEEVIQAGEDLKAKAVIPVHWGKFALGNHAWDEPVKRAVSEAHKRKMPLVLPRIGEKVNLSGLPADFTHWWEEVRK